MFQKRLFFWMIYCLAISTLVACQPSTSPVAEEPVVAEEPLVAEDLPDAEISPINEPPLLDEDAAMIENPIPPGWNTYLDSSWGYSLRIPADFQIDTSLWEAYVKYYDSSLELKLSKERSPYTDMTYYFDRYLNRFILNEAYRTHNHIQLKEDKWETINGYQTRIVSFSRQTEAAGKHDYLFAYLITEGREFYSFLFKTDALEQSSEKIYQLLHSFERVPESGSRATKTNFRPVLPRWNQETLDFYNRLKNTEELMWGFFTPDVMNSGQEKLAEMEAKLEYQFPIVLRYIYIFHDFPVDELQRAYEAGKVVELTIQTVGFHNDNQPRPNINFEIVDGNYDEQIRAMARGAKAFGHPFLLRLNNEMNTDWCQYSGVMLLSDPDIYIQVWRRIYDIFQEEGVDNAIWIFNPNDGNYPPVNWNSHISYYPGDEYVHLIGLTGYNTGDYFKSVTGEHWEEFNEIYDPLVRQYRIYYAHFPWMITEFASSSVGGDKVAWIRNMFRHLPNYPEIKAAVWWSYYDGDSRPATKGTPARRYWLDETEETLNEFKKGLH